MTDVRPNESEKLFLNLAYNRFYDLHSEVMSDDFWEKDARYRFSKVIAGFTIYGEILNYEPIQWVIEHLKKARPPMEAEIGGQLFKFIRNVIAHFPFFETWNDVWLSKPLVNWYRQGQSIDKFLTTYSGRQPVKYRFWEEEKKRMTYLSIKFPTSYNNRDKIFLRDILAEREGVLFAFIFMKQIMDTQVEQIQ
jgi:hypothetical protein